MRGAGGPVVASGQARTGIFRLIMAALRIELQRHIRGLYFYSPHPHGAERERIEGGLHY